MSLYTFYSPHIREIFGPLESISYALLRFLVQVKYSTLLFAIDCANYAENRGVVVAK